VASLASELYLSARRTTIAVIAVAGLAVAFLPWWVTSSTAIGARWVILGATLAIIMVAILFDAAFRLNRRSRIPLPAVKKVLSAPPSYKAKGPLLLLEPHALFSPGAAVSIYSKIDGFEILIGLGRVMTIQEDGRVQILVMQQENTPHGDIWERIQSDQHTAEGLIVRPSVPINSWIQETAP